MHPQKFSIDEVAFFVLTGWNRVVVEKPFGRDSESSEKLSNELMEVLQEKEVNPCSRK